ncbi:unnamed protein product [Vitrella brassicaformis CCMP3155]|uniref:UBA domain-containing protein n=1 Tax=Vitrella brassicaformis (strain CCMP3155) TaxID=1169540 RepID=A0A0G4E9X4_VITBC|nr:unnamed protein product [Vitrella brassicaformis CCMP3155]|eukprot:CEL92452.1 unnamed protein product [Vitrella brassicaformis CCMP3155]
MSLADHVEQIKAMGFTEQQAKEALTACRNDINSALEAILSGEDFGRATTGGAQTNMANSGMFPPPSTPKLYYFDFTGRAEPIRLAFMLGQVKFEDIRISLSEWPQMKGSMPQGMVPVLEIGDKRLTQKTAIMQYAAKAANLWPQDVWLECKMAELHGCVEDVVSEVRKIRFTQDQERKNQLCDAFKATFLPEWLQRLDSLVAANGHEGFAVGGDLTVADLDLYNLLNLLDNGESTGWLPVDVRPHEGQSCWQQHTHLAAVYNRVDSIPQVKEWNDNHPVNRLQ